MAPAEFRVGTSGYQYPHWWGVFYPDDLPQQEWFGYFAERYDTVEINSTFYRLPEAETFDNWRERAPEGFLYALKYSRYATHRKHLKDPEGPLELFMDRARRLGPLLGPILVQLRPNWRVNVERLAGFLQVTPPDRRFAFEFRDPTWLCERVFALLREHGAALCIHDMIEDHPREVSADWVYLRYHGGDTWGDYPYQALVAEAGRIEDCLADGLDVYAYFNNDAEGYALRNAADLRRYVEGEDRCS